MIQFTRFNSLILSRKLGQMPEEWLDDKGLCYFWSFCHSYSPDRKNNNLFSGFL